MAMTIRSLYISVKNMERAVDFYTDFLGVRPDRKDNRYSIFRLGAFYIGLYNPAADGTIVSYGDNTIPVFETDNLKGQMDWLKQKKVRFITDLITIGSAQIVQFIDPEGNIIQLSQVLKG